VGKKNQAGSPRVRLKFGKPGGPQKKNVGRGGENTPVSGAGRANPPPRPPEQTGGGFWCPLPGATTVVNFFSRGPPDRGGGVQRRGVVRFHFLNFPGTKAGTRGAPPGYFDVLGGGGGGGAESPGKRRGGKTAKWPGAGGGGSVGGAGGMAQKGGGVHRGT